VHDLMDNLARYAVPAPAPGALLTLTASNFTRVLHAAPLMLVAFSVRWCARCAALSAQLHRAAILLPSLQPAIDASIATIDMDDPQNAPLLRELGVVSFPIGKMYHDGRLLGSYLKGPTAAEIAQELVARASEIASNAANQRRRGLTVKDEV